MWSLATILVLLCTLPNTSGVYKRWITTTDFDNENNWDLGHLPCPNDHVLFPASTAPVVAINQDWTLSNITLSNDGIIVLADDLNIVFNDRPTLTGHCNVSKVIRYNFTEASHWLDPKNWCLPMHDFDSECFTGVLRLHTEMVPCVTDDVLFPGLIIPRHRSSFYISLDLGASMYISTMKIGHQYFSTASFKDYIDTDIGRKEFIQETGQFPSIINMTTRVCTDPAGCYCGTNQSPWKEKICSYIDNCPPAYCHTPFTPDGHCCPICGANMELVINSTTFSVFHIRDMLTRNFIQNKDKNYGNVLFDVMRKANGDSQLTLTDSTSGVPSTQLSVEVKQLLEQDASTDKTYGVMEVTNYQISGEAESTPAAPSTTTTRATTTRATTTRATTTPPNTTTTASTAKQPDKSTSPVIHTTPVTKDTKTTKSPTKMPTTPQSPATGKTETSTEAGERVTSQALFDTNDAVVIGVVVITICVLLLGSIGIVCIIFMRRPGSSEPVAVSMKFDETVGAGGNLTFSQGLDNPLYDDEGIDGVPMTTMHSAAANVEQAKTVPPRKKLTKKKSTGFDNPVFFDSKTQTVGAVDSGILDDQTFSNPLYDEDDEQEITAFEDNFM